MGLRCILANLGELQVKTILLEHTIKDSPESMVRDWLSHNPKIIGIGVYIWNIEVLTNAIQIIKKSHPHILIILGGPEVSYGVDSELFNLVDYIVQLEGEEVFKNLCEEILNNNFPKEKVIKSTVLDVRKIEMPYAFYTDIDVRNRKIYVEASRGCAFKCHFCLSSLDDGIRNFDIDLFLIEIDKLYQRGVRQFKFVDRTFNLNINLSVQILTFFLDTYKDQNFFLHFEVIPDRLPTELKKYLVLFKPGVLQFEVGIQTFDKDVSNLIGRKQSKIKAIENLSYLRSHTNAHLHVDLIIGLPKATLQIFKKDLNELVSIGLQEVQVGLLKNLKGTPIKQHIEPYKMLFDLNPPYEINSTIDIDHNTMLKLKRFQKFWDKFYNSGNFPQTMNYLFSLSNPFDEFFELSEYSYSVLQKTYGISLDQLCDVLYNFLQEKKKISHVLAREFILKDILIKKGRKVPKILKDNQLGLPQVNIKKSSKSLTRQSNF
jgi:radical SAM superfamily enzyme YgiQ (UPF0313 family)